MVKRRSDKARKPARRLLDSGVGSIAVVDDKLGDPLIKYSALGCDWKRGLESRWSSVSTST